MSGQVVIKRVPDDLGHFTALTPEVHQRLLVELRVGDWPQLAAYRARVSAKSVKRWLDKGLEDCAVEPYSSFAADVVQLEAELAGKLMQVIMDDALGKTQWSPDCGRPRPNVATAQWLLQNRFRFFWGTKDGAIAPAGMGIVELVERQTAMLDEGKRDQARKILAALPTEARAEARKKGFLI